MTVTHAGPAATPFVLMAFGVGMTAGNLIVPRFADRALMPSAGIMLAWTAVMLALYPFAAHSVVAITLDMLAIGFGVALATILQTRLMDVAGEAQGLAAALNHSAFNTANALGPWLGGMAIAAGYGFGSTGFVGAGLALAGIVVWAAAWAADRRAS
jgi:DHA1 family inner membrane transport protein